MNKELEIELKDKLVGIGSQLKRIADSLDKLVKLKELEMK